MSAEAAVNGAYLLSAVLFIFGIKRLTKVRTARQGNGLSALAMLIAIVTTLVEMGMVDYRYILIGLVVGSGIGLFAAYRVQMTGMPEMVALLNGVGGAASALVALSVLWREGIDVAVIQKLYVALGVEGGTGSFTLMLSVLIGSVTLSGSLIAYLKLAERISGRPMLMPGRHVLNVIVLCAAVGFGIHLGFFADTVTWFVIDACVMAGASLLLGVLLVIPIGGADMPVVISLLNSYSGLAACATGFVIGNPLLIISGAMVGAAGLILTKIMCVAMNRSLANVIFGGFGADAGAGGGGGGGQYENVTSCGVEEAAMILEDAESVVFVPGYGMAVAQAQHVVRDLATLLEERDVTVKYAIHPVAGRMPGHMNVLLAEADVPYEQLIEMDEINPEFKDTDVAIVIGANDVVNPAALEDKTSPIYGMPILKVFEARTVFVIKRGLGAGFAGIKNTLFEGTNTMMVYGDAKKVIGGIISDYKESAPSKAA
jgi:H+-translocating NAD(P) transhydrogenase subunit beta